MNPVDAFTHYLEHMRTMPWKYKLLYTADNLGHKLHLPRWVFCDRFDAWLLGKENPR